MKDFIIQHGVQYALLGVMWLVYLCAVIVVGRFCWNLVARLWLERENKLLKTKDGLFDNTWFHLLLPVITGFVTFGILSLPFYVFTFDSSSIVYTAIIGILVAVSLIDLLRSIFRKRLLLRRRLKIFFGTGFRYRLNAKSVAMIIGAGLLVALLVFDGLFSLVRLNHIADGSDANVHLSRIDDMTENGIGIRDGFFEGVDETRYAFNFVYTLFIPIATAAHLFGQSSFETAIGSSTFFRAIQVLAIGALAFALARLLLPRYGPKFAFVVSAFSICVGLFVNHFAYSFYPNIVVLAWFATLVIALLAQAANVEKRKSMIILIISALGIAGTHPTYAIVAAVLIAAVRVFIFIYDLIVKKRAFNSSLWVSIGLIGLLLLPGIFVFLQPNLMTEQAVLTESNAASLQILGVNVFPPVFGLTDNIAWNLMQIVGIGGIIILAFRRSVRVGILCATILGITLLTITNPLFISIMNLLHIPYWVMSRFSSINIFLVYGMTLSFGLVFIFLLFRKLVTKNNKMVVRWTGIVGGVIIVGWLGWTLLDSGYGTYRQSYKFAEYNRAALGVLDTMKTGVSPYIEERALVLATYYTSYYLPVAKPTTVIYTDSLHMPPGADGDSRHACQTDLFSQLGHPHRLRASGVRYVVIDRYQGDEAYQSAFDTMDQLRNDYVLLNKNAVYAVFRVLDGETTDAPVSCLDYQHVEK